MTADHQRAVQAYADAVRVHLADFPDAELDDAMDDVREHLADIAAELGEDLGEDSLVDRLGTPAQYAAELRAAAGLVPAGTPDPRKPESRAQRMLSKALWAARIVVLVTVSIILAGANPYALAALAVGLVAFVAAAAWARPRLRPGAASLPEVRWSAQLADAFAGTRLGSAAVPFTVTLRPAWWVVRALIAVNAIALLVDDGRLAFPMPGSDRSAALLWLVLTAGAVIVSVRLGLERGRQQRWSKIVVAVNVVLAAAAFPVLATPALTGIEYYPVYEEFPPDYGVDNTGVGGQNLFVYDKDGNLLTDVRIYDQDGNPIRVDPSECDFQELNSGRALADSQTLFPRPSWAVDPETGECVERGIVPPFGVGLPGPLPGHQAPVPTPSEVPSEAPSASPGTSPSPIGK